ncbi:hypothetical protein PTKIN_Ptkin13bG0203600 [Pterospermum kingtungense]
MAKMEKSVLFEDNVFEFEEENVVNEREKSKQLAEETVQRKLHQRDFENVDKKKSCYIEKLHVIGVDLLSKIQNLENGFGCAFTESTISELPVGKTEMSKLVAGLNEQIQIFLAELKQLRTLYSCENAEATCGYYDLEILKSSDLISQKQHLSFAYQEDSDLVKELSAKLFEIKKLKSDNLHKENELEALRHRQKELETQICSVEKEKSQLEENMEIMRREVVVTAKFLDDLRGEMMELDSNRDSQSSANKIRAKKSSELENENLLLPEPEEENLLLSERLNGLEEKLIYLTEEKESCHMELLTSESETLNFKDEIIKRLEDEMEVQRIVMRQKMEEMHMQWREVQEECEHLKVENVELIEECSRLQKENGELKRQKMEVHERCVVLEADLRESEKLFSNILNKVDNLQRENQLLEEEILAQLQKKVLLQDAILALKKTISEIKFENEMLEASFTMLSRDYEELEVEASLLVQKIFNSCRCGKVALEESYGTQEALQKSELADGQADNQKNCNIEIPQFIGVELAEALEANDGVELAEALEANDMYKSQLKSLLSKEVSLHLDVPEKLTGEGAAGKDRCECKVSSTLEIEMSSRYQIC